MEFSIRRKHKQFKIKQKLLTSKQKQSQQQQLKDKSSKVYTQANISMFGNDMQENLLRSMNKEIKQKACMLLSLPVSPRLSVIPKKDRARQSELSLMNRSKKKIALNQINQTFGRKKKIQIKYNNSNQKKLIKQSIYANKQNKQIKTAQNGQKNQTFYKVNHADSFGYHSSITRRNPVNYYSVADYLQLAFSKILSKTGKQKIYTFIQQLSKRYIKYPQIIQKDVIDIQSISLKLRSALGPKQKYSQLRPFEVLQVNGELARLIFHLCHEITARKYKDYDLVKIYKEIQYYSRKLQLHSFTLKVCFQIGQIYKERNDQINSHLYLVKALKMAIFLNDKFHQQKAIDCFGLTAFSSSKISQAYYFHENASKLTLHQRQTIKQKYSNTEQIQKISLDKQLYSQPQKINSNKKKQTFSFNGIQFIHDLQIQNRKKFKGKINKYIQCPIMRSNILLARNHMHKIDNVGIITRHKNFQTSRTPRFHEDMQSSSQVILTHRSLNRKNPQSQNRTIQKQRKILIQLINYFTNQHMFKK